MKSREEVIDTLETIIMRKKEAEEIKQKLHESNEADNRSFNLSSEMFDTISKLNEEIRRMLFVSNVVRGRTVRKPTDDGWMSEEFVHDDKYLRSFLFLGNKIVVPEGFTEKEDIKFSHFSFEESLKKVTSNEFIVDLLFKREMDKVQKERFALSVKVHEKQNELIRADMAIKKLDGKIRFSLFNKKALLAEKERLLESRTKIAEELETLKLAYAEKKAQEESLSGKYAKYIPTEEVRESIKNEFIKEYQVIADSIEQYNKKRQERLECKKKSYGVETCNHMRKDIDMLSSLAEELSGILASNPENRSLLDSIVNDENCSEEVRALAGVITQMSEQKKVKGK